MSCSAAIRARESRTDLAPRARAVRGRVALVPRIMNQPQWQRRSRHFAGHRGRVCGQSVQSGWVSVVSCGDGALNNGAFQEGVNLAAKWNIGEAIDTKHGLLVTVVYLADRLGVLVIAARTSQLIAATRDGSLTREELFGGAFTGSSGTTGWGAG